MHWIEMDWNGIKIAIATEIEWKSDVAFISYCKLAVWSSMELRTDRADGKRRDDQIFMYKHWFRYELLIFKKHLI